MIDPELLNLEKGIAKQKDAQLLDMITARSNELLLTPNAASMDAHPILREMGESIQDTLVRQAMYKNKKTNTSYLVESGPSEQGGESYILISWLTLGKEKGDMPGGWIKVMQYNGGKSSFITGAREHNVAEQQDTLWESGRARDFYTHIKPNSEAALTQDEIQVFIEQMGALDFDHDLTEKTSAYSEFSRAEMDLVSTAVDYWHASEGVSVDDIQKHKSRFEHAEKAWGNYKEKYTPAVISYETEESSSEEQQVHAEVAPLMEARMEQVRRDLIDIDLRIKAAGEKAIVKSFAFKEVEKGYIQIEFTTHEGVAFVIELGALAIDSESSNNTRLKKDYLGVRTYRASIAETGNTYNILEPPFLMNKKAIAAMHIREPDHSSLGEITTDDIDNLTDEGIRFLVRKYRDQGRYYPGPNIAAYPLPLTLIEASIGFHEQSHADDPSVADLVHLNEQWNSRRKIDKPRELLQGVSNSIFTTEDYANTESIHKSKMLTDKMRDQSKIMANIARMSALTMRSYMQLYHKSMDKSLLLSKKDLIYGRASSEIAELFNKTNRAIEANDKLSALTDADPTTLDSLVDGIIQEREMGEQKKPTWTSLAKSFLSSCIKR